MQITTATAECPQDAVKYVYAGKLVLWKVAAAVFYGTHPNYSTSCDIHFIV